MLYKLFRIVCNSLLSLFYLLMTVVTKILVVAIQLVVLVALLVYFFLTYWFPAKKRHPFNNAMKYERMAFLDTLDHNGRTLYLELDDTLVHCSRTKPNCKEYTKIRVRTPTSEQESIFYMVKRPYLQEFLQEVSL